MFSRLAFIVPAFLAVQTGVTYWAAGGERPPSPPNFASFPAQLGDWQKNGDDPITPETQAILGADRTLGLIYSDAQQNWSGSLFVAWFQSQRGGASQPHSPQVCLPAAGWTANVIGQAVATSDDDAVLLPFDIVSGTRYYGL